MSDFFEYLTQSPDDKEWGLYLNVAGCATISPESNYPPNGHPSGYNFNWKNGRVLHEYQINYITQGSGTLETRTNKYNLKEGSLMIIRPGVWHRYRPLSKTGWKEYYVGFNGAFAKKMFSHNNFIAKDEIIINIGHNETVIQLFLDIIENVKNEKIGFQQVCSGQLIHLVSLIVSIRKNDDFSKKEIENKIQKARLIIREKTNENIDISDLAYQLNIGYSLFRKMFKKYTGISPAQYHLSLRIEQAKNLLLNSNMSIKEIAYSLDFNSIYYFSRLFKNKTGKNPSEYRNSIV